MRWPGLLALVVSLLPMSGAGGQTRAANPAFQIIVHPSNPVTSIDRKLLVDMFLKRITRWPNDEQIRPVDQDPDSAVRRRFSEDVLKRSVAAVKSYWQQAIFSGRDVPPPELDGDEAVVKYVLRHAGGVGYIAGNANPGGAKTLSVR